MKLDVVQQAAQEQFAKQSQLYGSGHRLADVDDVAEALARLSLPENARVLDVAAGAGHTGLYIASLGHEVICADLAEPMLVLIREAATQRGLVVETRQHAAEEMPYPDGSFDLITCRIAAHHFSSPQGFLTEVARLLRPNGFFLLIDRCAEDDEPEAEAWIHEVEKLRDPSHHRLLTPRAWTNLCERNGLEVKSAEVSSMKQPSLAGYFETAATPAKNRSQVRKLVAEASVSVRRVFHLVEAESETAWSWPLLTLIAQRQIAT